MLAKLRMDATFVIAIGKRNMSAGSILPPFIVQVLPEVCSTVVCVAPELLASGLMIAPADRSKPERSLNCVRRPTMTKRKSRIANRKHEG